MIMIKNLLKKIILLNDKEIHRTQKSFLCKVCENLLKKKTQNERVRFKNVLLL